MANDEQEMLFDIFQAVSSQQYGGTIPTSPSAFNKTENLGPLIGGSGGQITGADTNADLSTLVSSLGANQGTGGPSSPGNVTEMLQEVMSSVGSSQAGGGQTTSGSGLSEPSVINMSAEAGGRLNSEPTTVAVEPYGSSGSGGSSGGSSILSLVSSALGGGLGVIPLVSGLMGLFGGGSSEPPPLEKYVQPNQLDFTGADTPGGIEDADYNQYGMPRLYSDATTTSTSQSGSLTTAGATGSGAGSPINVTIQALDSQSFLDRSNDIAQAVRQAMLSSSSINDVINDLQ
jgi:hypothetical protein